MCTCGSKNISSNGNTVHLQTAGSVVSKAFYGLIVPAEIVIP
jgi:hypothetical protein